MSKKKERKIKRLRRISIWPVLLKQTLTESAIFLSSIIISVIVILTVLQENFIGNRKDCSTVVRVVNEIWQTKNKTQIYERMRQLEQDLDHVEKIFLLDESFNPIPGINDGEFDPQAIKEIQKSFSQKKEFDYIFDDNFIDLSPLLKGKWSFASFFKSISVNALFDDVSLDWLTKEKSRINISAVYKTDTPGVFIYMSTPFIITNTYQHGVKFIIILLLVELIVCIILELSSILSLVRQKRRVTRLVTIDSVTGGFNRYYFLQKAGRLIKKQRKNYAVVQIRLEKYRNLCTAYGVKNGENILESLDISLRHFLESQEIVSHLEDADFALLLGYANNDELTKRVGKILDGLRNIGESGHLNFSAGICPVQGKKSDVSILLNEASLALPKEVNAQNNIAWFDKAMRENTVWERRLEDDMEKAIENHEFSVYLQPKYSAQNETLDAAEALVRWIHPELGFISPGSFIPLFEKNGFILKLDDYMLSEVCKLQSKWISEGKNVVPISVNVSRAHFAIPNLAEHIKQIVDQWSVPYEYIELELTESAFFDDKATLIDTVKKLKDYGFKLSMDDFGAGYSSLNSLKELPLDIIKLDAEFFRGVEDLSRSNMIVGDTIALAKKLGMRIVAEGIETREQVDFLAKKDCDLIQGFYFSKPLPVNEFESRAFPEEKKDEEPEPQTEN